MILFTWFPRVLHWTFCILAIMILFPVTSCPAQPGISEMNQATAQLRQSFFSARSATLVLAAIFGIAGAVAVYHNWQMGKERITAEVAAWFFAAFFMILLSSFLQSLFGI